MRIYKTIHGKSGTPIYWRWREMVSRCTNPKNKAFECYGARGITVSQEWLSFDSFYKDMGDPPAGKTMERINNDLGYSKENCRWATMKEQGRNQRSNIWIEHEGKRLILRDWAVVLNISYHTLRFRHRSGLKPPELLYPSHLDSKATWHSPKTISHEGESKSITQWARDLGIPKHTIITRLKRGFSSELALSKTRVISRLSILILLACLCGCVSKKPNEAEYLRGYMDALRGTMVLTEVNNMQATNLTHAEGMQILDHYYRPDGANYSPIIVKTKP